MSDDVKEIEDFVNYVMPDWRIGFRSPLEAALGMLHSGVYGIIYAKRAGMMELNND